MIDADLPAELRTDPGFVEMESKCPGVISAMSKAVEPVARRELENNAEVHRGAMAEMFRKDLSEQEASEANAFFASPLGRRYSAAFLDTGTTRNASAERQTQRSVSREAVEADLNEGGQAALTSLNAADRSELERIMTTVPWAIRFNGLQPAIVELNLRQQNAPQSETYSQAVDAAMRKAASERLRACGIRLVQ
jgi:hypothetical protein